jgi:D-sedoheptulose 7-phosphate isomerase
MDVTEQDLQCCANLLRAAVTRGSRIYSFGNGGSATTASHFACDMWHRRPSLDGRRARTCCLNDDVAIMTAVANDYGYDRIFAQPLSVLLDERDVLVAISVSGASPNVLRALELGRQRGAFSLALLGTDGGPAGALADVMLRIPCDDPGVVESAHLAIAHDLAVRMHEAPGTASCRART